MIKQTFYNLPQEKKDRLIKAAKNEFTRVSYNEASINKIIKEAQISRGSFYTYFDNKSDLVRYMMDEYFRIVTEQINRALEVNNGDIFAMFTELFDITFKYTEIKNDMALFHSLFKTMHSSADFAETMIYHEKARKEHEDYIVKKIDRKRLNVKNDDELRDLLDVCFIITRHSLGKAFAISLPKEAARKSFLYALDILKNGVLVKDQSTEGK